MAAPSSWKPGGYIYEVTAQWDDSQGSGGTAHYAFYIRSSHSSLCGYPPADSLGQTPPSPDRNPAGPRQKPASAEQMTSA